MLHGMKKQLFTEAVWTENAQAYEKKYWKLRKKRRELEKKNYKLILFSSKDVCW